MTVPSSPDAIPRRPGGDLIEAVVENMRRNLEPLKYSVLAPSRYVVYLHPDEFARFEGILPLLQEQTTRALDEAILKLNTAPMARRMLDRVLGSAPPVQNPAREWQVEFLPDPDGEVGHGDILIHSELLLPAREELGAGQRTRRIATMHVGTRTTVRQEVSSVTGPAAARPVARLKYLGRLRRPYLRHGHRRDLDRPGRRRLPGRRADCQLGGRFARTFTDQARPFRPFLRI